MDDLQVLTPSYTDEGREEEAYFADIDAPSENYDGYRSLCAGIIEGCLAALAVPPPPSTGPTDTAAHGRWARSWQRWLKSRRREIHFASGRNFYVVCEAAGLDADVFLEYLQGHNLLDDPADMVPHEITPTEKNR